MKTRTIYVTVRIDYTFDETVTNWDESVWDAKDLAIVPDYEETQNGVKIDAVIICDEDLNEE